MFENMNVPICWKCRRKAIRLYKVGDRKLEVCKKCKKNINENGKQ